MTPSDEQETLESVAKKVDRAAKAAYDQMMADIRAGAAPRDAVAAAMRSFTGDYAGQMAAALSKITGETVGTASVLDYRVGNVTLSHKLYAEGNAVATVVAGIVERHAQGFQDARRLALQIYEGYGFRTDEPLKIGPNNPVLPKYLRDELLSDPGLLGDMQRFFAKVQANDLKTPALKAAYLQYLDELEAGMGWDVLGKRLETAYAEKVRYMANRIAQTELHRAYAQRQAEELLNDSGVEYVQWRTSPSHPKRDICDVFADVNGYGLGPGVYPKGKAPVAPAHPHCRCYLKPRTDIRLGAKAKPDPDAARRYVEGLGADEGGRLMGGRSKWDRVAAGADPWAVHNDAILLPEYRVKTVDEIVALRMLGRGVTTETLRQYWDAATDAGKWHDAAFKGADANLLTVIERVGDPKMVKHTPKKSGAHMLAGSHIEMDGHDLGNLRSQSTWRHEYGHHIDYEMGPGLQFRSSAPDFTEAIKADSRAMVKNSAAGSYHAATTVKQRQVLANEYGAAARAITVDSVDNEAARLAYLKQAAADVGLDFDEFARVMVKHTDFANTLYGVGRDARYAAALAAMKMEDAQGFMDAITGGYSTVESSNTFKIGAIGKLSDLFGSVTLNKVSGYNRSGNGHSNAYYNASSANRGTETFANLTAFHGDEDHAIWDVIINAFTPKTNAVFKQVIKDAAQ